MEDDISKQIESVYERLAKEQEQNAALRELVAKYKELYIDMKACRDESAKLADDAIRELRSMRKRIENALHGGGAA
jgi:translation initiation factor 2B subunit (eIF-2B alpha/beta/delta family)